MKMSRLLKLIPRLTVLAAGLVSACALAAGSGWEVSNAKMWRLLDKAEFAVNTSVPANFIDRDKIVRHRELSYRFNQGLTTNLNFRVGCLIQSPTPVIDITVSPLDIAITDQFNGYAFARFLVDKETEYTLRGEFYPPARLVFAPMTRLQYRSMNNLIMQMREGKTLKYAILQGYDRQPRLFEIPLIGFVQQVDEVLGDCARLHESVPYSDTELKFLPDYVSVVPVDAAPAYFTLKGFHVGSDGLGTEEDGDEAVAQDYEQSPPDVHYFTPGGSAASIGPDGLPIQSGKSGREMAIGPDGFPIR